MSEAAVLIIDNGALKGFQRVLRPSQVVVIGRGEDCDIRLPSALEFMGVSRHHCLLRIGSDGIRVRDLESRNGTFVNDVMLGAAGEATEDTDTNGIVWRRLNTGDDLRVGGIHFRVMMPSEEPDAPVHAMRSDEALQVK